MNEENWKALRVKELTHQRIKMLAVDSKQTIDEFLNTLADTYERSYALSRGFAKRERETELT